MKMLPIVTLVLVAACGSAVDAQAKRLHASHHRVTHAAHVRSDAARSDHRAEWDVYRNGHYIGADPDPLVRDMMRRDVGLTWE
jgi:hypothetical protein